jgi:ribosomal protein S12 methylthiotransferase
MEKGLINIVTLGCSKNIVDSEKIMRQLEAGGYQIVYDSNITNAETVIINTCGFINDAKEESIDTILRFVKARRSEKIKNLYVMGCLSERYMNALKDEIPEVTKYFGVNNFKDILNELGVDQRDDLLLDRNLSTPKHFAYLKVSEGCDRTCAFCAIPIIRGKCISRPVEDIIGECKILVLKGVKEIILIAQDLSYYGMDLYGKQMLPQLLKELVKIDDLEWVRLHYLYPANFPEELIEIIRDNPKICRYIDIPIQHITDNMLKYMRRSHGRVETETLLERLRKGIPGVAIRTTLIAGHPGETEEDYNELKDYISSFKFDKLGVFPYSHEEETYAYNNYEDSVDDKTKQMRVSELMDIQQNISAELNRQKWGEVYKVLIDRREGEYFVGRTEFDSPEVDQEVLIPVSAKLVPGNFYNIKIINSSEFDLFGEPV